MNNAKMIFAITIFFSASTVSAQHFLTAGQLLDLCAVEGRPDCYQYLSGAHDAISASQYTFLTSDRIVSASQSEPNELRNLLIRTGDLSCIPAGTDAEALRQSFVRWMISNDSAELSAGRILGAAFAQAFPCSY